MDLEKVKKILEWATSNHCVTWVRYFSNGLCMHKKIFEFLKERITKETMLKLLDYNKVF